MTAFIPTHTLTINDSITAVAVVDNDWQPCEPGPGAQLVTRDEWESEGAVSYTLDADGDTLFCNGDAHGYGNGSWSLRPISPAGVVGEAEGAEDRRHDDGDVRDEDGIEIPAPYRAPKAWTHEGLLEDYRRHYRAARG